MAFLKKAYPKEAPLGFLKALFRKNTFLNIFQFIYL
jgi:hypothetical protein